MANQYIKTGTDYNRTMQDIWQLIADTTGVAVDSTYRTNYIDDWRDWFQGYSSSFHTYSENVMGVNKAFARLSLGAAGKSARAWAELLTREFPEIAIDDANLQNKVEKILKDEEFKSEFVKYLELAFGVGTAAMVEYIVGEDIHIDFLDVDSIVPLSWHNGKILELATINLLSQGGVYYTHIQYNRSVGGNYVITNDLYASDDEGDVGHLVDPAILGIEDLQFDGVKPFFQVIKPNLTNKIDIDNPLGMSVFQDAMDTVKAIDKKYTEFDNEFCLGKKRIVVSSDALKKQIDTDSGQWVSYLGSDTVYQAVSRDGEPLFQAVDFTLREQSYINALNQEFNFLADSIGMDAGAFVFNGVSMKTATEVISEKSKTFGNKKKHDKVIKDAIYGCVMAIINCIEVIENRKYNAKVTVTMSDAVLIDAVAKKNDERIDVQNGYMPKTEYLMRNYGLSETVAKEWVARAKSEDGTVTSETLEQMFQPRKELNDAN